MDMKFIPDADIERAANLSKRWQAALDLSVERAHAERRLLTSLALKQIKRMAEFPARSAGQKQRRKKEAQKYCYGG